MLSFRNMIPGDLDRIHEIFQASFSHPWSLNAIQEEFFNEAASYLVALLGDKVVGFIGAWLVFDEAQITNIALDPSYRGRGYGHTLLKEFISRLRAQGLALVFLEVRPSNLPARRLYESFNFRMVGLRKNFYQDGEAAILMELDLRA